MAATKEVRLSIIQPSQLYQNMIESKRPTEFRRISSFLFNCYVEVILNPHAVGCRSRSPMSFSAFLLGGTEMGGGESTNRARMTDVPISC